jgi:hypothetical protein
MRSFAHSVPVPAIAGVLAVERVFSFFVFSRTNRGTAGLRALCAARFPETDGRPSISAREGLASTRRRRGIASARRAERETVSSSSVAFRSSRSIRRERASADARAGLHLRRDEDET